MRSLCSQSAAFTLDSFRIGLIQTNHSEEIYDGEQEGAHPEDDHENMLHYEFECEESQVSDRVMFTQQHQQDVQEANDNDRADRIKPGKG